MQKFNTVLYLFSCLFLALFITTANYGSSSKPGVFTAGSGYPASPLVKFINLNSPNGGETWQAGTNHLINWTSTDINFVTIEYSTDNGGSWTTIINQQAASTNNYIWNIPQNVNSTQALVRIYDFDDPFFTDVSDAVFSISRLQLQSPTIGQKLLVNSTHAIQWIASGNIANVKLEYSTNAGNNWQLITASTNAAIGSYNWTVPNSPTTQALIRISDAAMPAIIDTSDSFIISSLTVVSPNGGEVFNAGSTQQISWTSNNVSFVKLEYSIDNGLSWTTIVNSFAAGTGSYTWSIPNAPTNEGLIRISDASYPNVRDLSDNVFSIRGIQITAPNGGEGLKIGSNYNIFWTSNITTNVKIEITTDNGSTWSQIAASVAATAGSYIYAVPNTPTNQAKIRITSLIDPSLKDESDTTFTIGNINITSPLGGESWLAGSTQTINFNVTNGIDIVRIDYSTKNGTSLNLITSSTPASTGT
jgi:hypothetical protein